MNPTEKKTIRENRFRPIPFVMLILLTAFDQLTKTLAVHYLGRGRIIFLIPGVFELRYLENRGAAFGILQNRQILFILLTAAVIVLVIRVFVLLPSAHRYLPLRVLCIILLAGASGNLIDRIFLGYVRDFLYFVLINFPIFNVADIYVTGSAAAAAIFLIFVYKDEDFSFLKKDR